MDRVGGVVTSISACAVVSDYTTEVVEAGVVAWSRFQSEVFSGEGYDPGVFISVLVVFFLPGEAYDEVFR